MVGLQMDVSSEDRRKAVKRVEQLGSGVDLQGSHRELTLAALFPELCHLTHQTAAVSPCPAVNGNQISRTNTASCDTKDQSQHSSNPRDFALPRPGTQEILHLAGSFWDLICKVRIA
jgi:hypothetical protein